MRPSRVRRSGESSYGRIPMNESESESAIRIQLRDRAWCAALAIAAGSAFAANAAIAFTHAQAKQLDSPELWGCGAGASACAEVWTSPYSHVLGISLAIWGLGYALSVLAALAACWRSTAVWSALLLPTLTSVGAIVGVWLSGLIFVELESRCAWCLAVHGLNIITFLASIGRARILLKREVARRTETGESRSLLKSIVAAIAGGLLLSDAVIGFVFLFRSEPQIIVVPVPGIDDPVAYVAQSNNAEGPRTASGSDSARRGVVLFSCLTCSSCRQAHHDLSAWQATHREELRIEYRFAPLSPACNPRWHGTEPAPEQRHACELAKLLLAVALADQRQFEPFQEWLYEHQLGLTLEAADAEAERRIGRDYLTEALKNPAIAERLRSDVAQAERLQVKTVPKLFMKNGSVVGPLTSVSLKRY
jgi:uncharacterized membrane protein/protein-disulfide isomerase